MGLHSPRYRGGRRRRVLLEEARGDDRRVYQASRSGRKRRYLPDALGYSQPVITDFLPERKRTIITVVTVSLLTSALVSGADAWIRLSSLKLPDEVLAGLHSFGPGSLASFLAALQFLAGAIVCWLIFSVRQKRLDDFHGTYRLWIASSITLAIFALLSAVPLLPAISCGLQLIPQFKSVSDPALLGRSAIGIVAGATILRWLIEMRRCRLAQTCLAAAGVVAGLSLLDPVKILSLSSYTIGQAISNGLFILAIHIGLLGLLIYGRHVRLDAQGRVWQRRKTARKKKIRVREVIAEVDPGDLADEEDSSSGTETQSLLGALMSRESESEDSREDDIDFRELSKAERKRMRRERR